MGSPSTSEKKNWGHKYPHFLPSIPNVLDVYSRLRSNKSINKLIFELLEGAVAGSCFHIHFCGIADEIIC